jgi:hypothetical protein
MEIPSQHGRDLSRSSRRARWRVPHNRRNRALNRTRCVFQDIHLFILAGCLEGCYCISFMEKRPQGLRWPFGCGKTISSQKLCCTCSCAHQHSHWSLLYLLMPRFNFSAKGNTQATVALSGEGGFCNHVIQTLKIQGVHHSRGNLWQLRRRRPKRRPLPGSGS